jgi:hypothetical protein
MLVKMFFPIRHFVLFLTVHKNMSMKKYVLGLLAILSYQLHAQNIYLRNETLSPLKNIDQVHSVQSVSNQSWNGYTFCITQFSRTTSLKERKGIEAQTGIRFFDYLPSLPF